MAVRIFLHAWRMIFSNFGAVVKLSMPIILVILVAIVAFAGFLRSNQLMAVDVRPQAIGIIFLLVIAYLLAFVWTAVAWHRYVLLAEYPNAILPPFRGGRILSYIGYAVLLGLIMSIVGALGMAMIYGVSSVLGTDVIAFILGVVFVGFLIIASFRLGIVLPAAAIGEPLAMGAAWDATRPLVKTLIGLLGLLILFGFALGIATAVAEALSPVFGMVVNLLLTWLQSILNLSILTTLYGVAVQGRDID